MLTIVIAMLLVLVVSALVVTYVAFPHRGEEVPGAPWLGDAMNKATDAMPLLEEDGLAQAEDYEDEEGSGGAEPRDKAS